MGLSASQARLLILTAKNDHYELAAQMIESERLMLAQEQETIANEYSEKTTNQISTTRYEKNGNTVTETTNLSALAKAQAAPGTTATVVIANANGDPVAYATADGDGNVTYKDKDGKDIQPSDSLITALNGKGKSNPLARGLESGVYQMYIRDPEQNSTSSVFSGTGTEKYVRVSPQSLESTTSRYYTEDDAAAQAEYQAAMTRVNNLDKRLENKLNQIETQKKAVETEMESVKSLVQSNVERTFKYFG